MNVKMIPGESTADDELQHLKQVSRVKHLILSGYLPPWAVILGSRHTLLSYVDCFAGPGKYELAGDAVDGSPIIATRAAAEFGTQHPNRHLDLTFVEDDELQVTALSKHLGQLGSLPGNVRVRVKAADSHSYVPELLKTSGTDSPAFFLIDPYGHPLSLPVINDILRHQRAEVLINLMWYRINMDMANAAVQDRVSGMFGHEEWRKQDFIRFSGHEREQGFLKYFCSHLDAQFVLPFRIRFDVEDQISGKRTKYYLLHASNHPKAVLLMKEVMWPLGDEEGTFDFSGESQGVLISRTPQQEELRHILLRKYAGTTSTFDGIRIDTWELPFIEKHYRSVLLSLEAAQAVFVVRVSSKKSGLRRADRITFK